MLYFYKGKETCQTANVLSTNFENVTMINSPLELVIIVLSLPFPTFICRPMSFC